MGSKWRNHRHGHQAWWSLHHLGLSDCLGRWQACLQADSTLCLLPNRFCNKLALHELEMRQYQAGKTTNLKWWNNQRQGWTWSSLMGHDFNACGLGVFSILTSQENLFLIKCNNSSGSLCCCRNKWIANPNKGICLPEGFTAWRNFVLSCRLSWFIHIKRSKLTTNVKQSWFCLVA